MGAVGDAAEAETDADDSLTLERVLAVVPAVLLAVDDGVVRPVIMRFGWNGRGVGQNWLLSLPPPDEGGFVVKRGVYFFFFSVVVFSVADVALVDSVACLLLYLFLL